MSELNDDYVDPISRMFIDAIRDNPNALAILTSGTPEKDNARTERDHEFIRSVEAYFAHTERGRYRICFPKARSIRRKLRTDDRTRRPAIYNG